MKAFVLLAAVSAAQAAPQWVLPYAAHAVATGNSAVLPTLAYHGLVYGKRSAEAEPEADADAYYGYYGYGYYGKRSADAEPEADADAYYGYYGYPYGYRAYGYGYGYPYRYYGKRSAEADPQVLTYGAGVLPYAAAAYPY